MRRFCNWSFLQKLGCCVAYFFIFVGECLGFYCMTIKPEKCILYPVLGVTQQLRKSSNSMARPCGQ